MRGEIFKRSHFHGTLFQLVLLINLYTINGDEELQIEPTETKSTLPNGSECRSECLLSNTCGSWLENTSAKSGSYRVSFLSAAIPLKYPHIKGPIQSDKSTNNLLSWLRFELVLGLGLDLKDQSSQIKVPIIGICI